MAVQPNFSAVAALVADPTRGRMLGVLMDGRARTATELALEGDVAPSTASAHLARLTSAGLVAVAKQGRHRYFRLASTEVAGAVEALMGLAVRSGLTTRRPGPRDPGLRRARVCYDHLAGEVAVRLLERLREERLMDGDDEALELTAVGQDWCHRVGIDLDALRAKRRPLCRPCLDWSERRTHLAGALGSALFARLLALRYARRATEGRGVVLAPQGEWFIEHLEAAR